jgi:hypothetical protein
VGGGGGRPAIHQHEPSARMHGEQTTFHLGCAFRACFVKQITVCHSVFSEHRVIGGSHNWIPPLLNGTLFLTFKCAIATGLHRAL